MRVLSKLALLTLTLSCYFQDTAKPISTLALSGLKISDGFEETQVAHSFILETVADRDPTSFYCDEEVGVLFQARLQRSRVEPAH